MDLGLPRIGGDLARRRVDRRADRPVSRAVRRRGGHGGLELRRRRARDVLPRGPPRRPPGRRARDRRRRDRAGVATWERVYQALDSRGRRHFRARRHRIEHFEMAEPGAGGARGHARSRDQRAAERSTRSGARPGGLYEQALGWERAEGDEPVPRPPRPRHRGRRRLRHARSRRWIRSAAVAAFGIAPRPGPAALARGGGPRGTIGSARLAHQEDKKGSLEPGKHADFAAYDVDPHRPRRTLDGDPSGPTVSLGRDVFAA